MTTKAERIQNQLDEWCREYGVTQEVKFMGWEDMEENGRWVLGRCNSYRNPLRCEIRLGIKWAKRELGWLEMSTLWHEFCHANAYLEDGVRDAHNEHWREYRKRKPKYWIGNLIGKIVYCFLPS